MNSVVWMLSKQDLVWCLRIQKDDSPHNPYMYVSSDGEVILEEDMKVVSTCRMDVHKFPFDTQRCNITIGSAIHCGEGRECVRCAAACTDLVTSTSYSPFSPQLMKSSSTLSPTRLGPRSSPERWWRRRGSGSSSNCPCPALTSPTMTDCGSSSYILYASYRRVTK